MALPPDSSKARMNSIFIHDLRVETRIGVYDWEAELPQTIRLDVEIGLPSDAVFASGDFADALDYAAVVKLMERFAQAVADLLIGEFGVPWVKLRVAKIAPLAGVREIGVTIERNRATTAT